MMLKIATLLATLAIASSDLPCASKETSSSVVCVCNSTYCDEITKGETLGSGSYRVYTTDKDGQRFAVTTGQLTSLTETSLLDVLTLTFVMELDPTTTYQTIQGFGGAVTDSAGINWLTLDEAAQTKLIQTYYGSNGLEYTFVRVPIGGSDFSTHAYTYNETPENDTELSNFTLSEEDYNYKLPMLKSIMANTANDVNILAATWSPPVWMKTNNAITGFSRLLEEYYQTYADYHIRFIEEYEKEGLSVWGISTANEPVNGIVPIASFNSIGMPPDDMANFVVNNLGPTIRNSAYNATKILAVDDQRYVFPWWIEEMVDAQANVLDYVDGFAVHFYGDFISPDSLMTDTHESYPNQFILSTETCTGSYPWESDVDLGSWSRGVTYVKDILNDLNNWAEGWIDWNLVLNTQGGPNWSENFVDSPIIVSDDGTEFYKQPMYYAIGHFSKFVPKGSVRIDLLKQSAFDISHTAFLRPDGSYAVILYNGLLERDVVIQIPSLEKEIELTLNSNSIRTIEIYP